MAPSFKGLSRLRLRPAARSYNSLWSTENVMALEDNFVIILFTTSCVQITCYFYITVRSCGASGRRVGPTMAGTA